MKSNLFYRFTKRLFDIVVSLIAIVIMIPLTILVAPLILLSSSGHIFYLDKRVGKNGKTFNLLKYRSMFKDAEKNISKYLTPEQIDKWNKVRKIENDPRVTWFGKFLRKTSLDEFPQFINVLFGKMSIIGPRPITEFEVKYAYSNDESKKLLSIKPGIVGAWAVNGRSSVEYEDHKRQDLELDYVDKRGFKEDLKIFIKIGGALFNNN